MTLRRALVVLPLAVTVAIAAHFLGFGAGHALGGSHGDEFFAVGLGGSVLLALAAVLWLGLSGLDARRGESGLLTLLPGGGAVPAAAATLAVSGFGAFAIGELLEGHSPFGTWATALALALVATVIAGCARALARWVAAGGAALARLIALCLAPPPQPALAVALRSKPLVPQALARHRRRGRAPPQLF